MSIPIWGRDFWTPPSQIWLIVSWNVRTLTAPSRQAAGLAIPGRSETSAHPSSQLHTHPQLSTSFLPSSQYLFLSPAPSPQPGTLRPPPLVLLNAATLLFPHWQELSAGGEQVREWGVNAGPTCFFHTRSTLEPQTSSLGNTWALVRSVNSLAHPRPTQIRNSGDGEGNEFQQALLVLLKLAEEGEPLSWHKVLPSP